MKSINSLLYTPLILQTAIWPVTRPLLRLFVHLDIRNSSNLTPLSPGVIFVSNHSSEWDPIIVPASLPFLSRFMPMFYVARPRAFYKRSSWRKYFYGGWLFRIWGAHPVASGSKDYAISLCQHMSILRRGKSVLIFPEGRRTLNGNIMLDEARGGAAYLAEQTGCPVVPIHIGGIFNMSFTDFFRRRRSVVVNFGRPIYSAELFASASAAVDNPYKAAMKNVMQGIARMGQGETLTYPEIVPLAAPSQVRTPKA